MPCPLVSHRRPERLNGNPRDNFRLMGRSAKTHIANCDLVHSQYWFQEDVIAASQVATHKEASMFSRAQVANDPDITWNSINRVRVSEGLDEYRAPSGQHQFIAAVLLILI